MKAILIGIDGLIPELVARFAGEGVMPTLAGLMARGAFSPMYSSPPVDTPTNWTSLGTGAWTGTHGINGFASRRAGKRLSEAYWFGPCIFPRFVNQAPAYLNQVSRAEYIWQAAERAGKRCILVNYPGGWPPNLQAGITIDGSGPYASVLARLSYPTSFVSGPAQAADQALPLVWQESGSWAGAPASALPPRASALAVAGGVALNPVADGWQPASGGDPGPIYHLLLVATTTQGYDRLLVARAPATSTVVAELGAGQWSDWLEEELPSEFGLVRAEFRLRLSELSADGQEVRLYRSTIFNPAGWSYPESIAHELIDDLFRQAQARGQEGFLESDGTKEDMPRVMPLCQVYESIQDQAVGLALATGYLARHHPWDLLCVQIHAPDGLQHEILNGLCPEWRLHTPEREAETWRRLREQYGVLDGMVGRILADCAGEDTVVFVVSDHGCIPTLRTVWPEHALLEAGLVSYTTDPATGLAGLDWERTPAIPGSYPLTENIWVNLKGREPTGVVEPGAEYEAVRRAIIAALLSLRDPESGACPIALALRKEDAAFMGQWGPAVGDVVYYLTPGYALDHKVRGFQGLDLAAARATHFAWVGEGVGTDFGRMQGLHGGYLPTARLAGCSVCGTLLMAGPGIRRGMYLPAPPWTVDVVPTLAHLLGIPAPAQAEGKIIGQALE